MFSSGGATEPPPAGGGTSAIIPETAPSFTIPGFYGQGSTTYFGGSGRLARPDFEMGLSFSVGYDDNIFQTASNTPDFGLAGLAPDQPPPVVEVKPAKPPGLAIEFVGFDFSGGRNLPPQPVYRVVRTPGRDAVFEPVKNVQQERVGSFLTRSNLHMEAQRFTRRSVFTLDFDGGRTFYWAKDKDPVDYNASLSAAYLYRFSPRLEMSASLNTAYLSQPDLSRPNTPEVQTAGDTINTLGRANLTYRFTPRISTTVSTSYNGLRFTDKTEQVGNYDQWTFGLEGRYLWQPRWTLLVEARQTTTRYDTNAQLDSKTSYFLVGTEFILSSRLTGSLRMGMNFKEFEVGSSQASPYVESSLSYRSTARSSVVWTNRFGFEEGGSPDEERLVYRSTIGYNYAFTPRLRGFANINLIHEINTNKATDFEFVQDTFDATIGVEYQLTKRFGLNTSYAFTITNSNTGTADYYRNRIYFGGQLSF